MQNPASALKTVTEIHVIVTPTVHVPKHIHIPVKIAVESVYVRVPHVLVIVKRVLIVHVRSKILLFT